MAKRPLTIWVHRQWVHHPAVAALRKRGHIIRVMTDAKDPDLILHPAAMWNNLDAMVLAAVAARKETKA